MALFAKELHYAGHVTRFVIQNREREGWRVLEEQDDTVVKQACYRDWHRVERALDAFSRRIGELQDRGWSVRR